MFLLRARVFSLLGALVFLKEVVFLMWPKSSVPTLSVPTFSATARRFGCPGVRTVYGRFRGVYGRFIGNGFPLLLSQLSGFSRSTFRFCFSNFPVLRLILSGFNVAVVRF